MTLVKPVDYIVTACYSVRAETKVGGVEFSRVESLDSPNKALELAKSWGSPEVKLSFRRCILFSEGKYGGFPKQKPISENITLGQLEGFVANGENLPQKQFYVHMSVEEARRRSEIIKICTGNPAEFVPALPLV